MKTRTTSTKLLGIVTALGVLAVLWTVWGASRAVAGPEPHLRTTGMVGIARGQTFQLNCLNLGSEPILVHFRILDSDGNPLAIMPCVVPPGQALSPSLNRDDISREGNRIELRAEESTDRERDQRNLLITVEVFNNSDGKTTFGFSNPRNLTSASEAAIDGKASAVASNPFCGREVAQLVALSDCGAQQGGLR